VQKPSKGRIVFVKVDPTMNNGDDEAPAIITRVFNDQYVNLRVLLDSEAILWLTSVPLVDEPPAEPWRAHTSETPGSTRVAWWPPRV